MDLETQIKLILFSIAFGIFFALMIDINHRFLYSEKKLLKIIFTFFFILANVFIYFLIIKKINGGILHTYSFVCIILGFFIEHIIKKKVVKIRK